MKTVKLILICLCAIVLCQCNDYHDIPGKVPYTVTTQSAEDINYTSATVSYKVNAPYANPEGVKGGIMWGTGEDLSTSQVVYSEKNYGRAIHLSNLISETTYYYRGFVEDELGNQIKGDILSFETKQTQVLTLPAKNVTGVSADVGYEVYGIANAKGGILLSTNKEMNDARIIYSSKEGDKYVRTLALIDLQQATTYYFQGFAEDESGNKIKGEVLSFSTDKVYVTTLPAMQISYTSADARYEVHGAPQANGGICLGKSYNLNDAHIIYSTKGSGNYVRTITLQDLEPGTEYFYAGFIEDKLGDKIMGQPVSFVTVRNKAFLWTQVPNSKFSSLEMEFASANYIYCAKGDNSTNELWSYQPKNNQWEQKSNVPRNGIVQSVYQSDERVYCILVDSKNDWNYENDTYELWLYNNNNWQDICAVPIKAYSLCPIFLYNQRIYVMDENWSIWEYDIAKNNWQQLANSRYPGSATDYTCLSWFCSNNKLYMGLGSTYQSPSYICYNDLWMYDVVTLRWTRLEDAPYYRMQIGWTSFELNGKGYLITVQDEYSSQSHNSLVYDIQKNKWQFIDDYADFGIYNRSARIGNDIYIFEGFSDSHGGFWKFNPK